MTTSDAAAIEVIQLMEQARLHMETLRAAAAENGFNARALSVAITELETAQLWMANARPE
jgi:hypothetical protein